MNLPKLCPNLSRCLGTVLLFSTLVTSVLAQPSLESVTPARNATQVSVTSPIIFTFDSPMAGVPPLEIPGIVKPYLKWSSNVSLSQFDYAWDEEFMVLTCIPNSEMPGDSLITWTLNPPDTSFALNDQFGFPLPETTGSFTTGTGGGPPCDPDGYPDDFGTCFLQKMLSYEQTGPATPMLSPDQNPQFIAVVDSPDVNLVTSVNLGLPNGSSLVLSSFVSSHYLFDEFNSQSALDTAYPAGNYRITMTRQTPPETVVTMAMPANSAYPPIPQVANYAAAQQVDPNLPFVLQWNSFAGATGMDNIQLMISDEQHNVILAAPDYCVPIALANTATSFDLPAGLLQSNHIYTAQLVFAKVFYFSTNNPAQFGAFGLIMRQTTFPIKTLGVDNGLRPEFEAASLNVIAGRFQFTLIDLVPGQSYDVEFSSTLLPGSWQFLVRTNATTSSITYTDPLPAMGARLYRAKKN